MLYRYVKFEFVGDVKARFSVLACYFGFFRGRAWGVLPRRFVATSAAKALSIVFTCAAQRVSFFYHRRRWAVCVESCTHGLRRGFQLVVLFAGKVSQLNKFKVGRFSTLHSFCSVVLSCKFCLVCSDARRDCFNFKQKLLFSVKKTRRFASAC